MVDAGWALESSEQMLARALEMLGYGFGDVSRFLVTHAHRDHYTQAVTVRRRFGTSVALGEHERHSLEQVVPGGPFRELAQLALLTAAGASALATELRSAVGDLPDRSTWERPDEWLCGGTQVTLTGRTLEVIHTPGHTRGHVVFHDPTAGVLFAGDHVLPHITPSIGFEQAPAASPLTDYLTSLKLVRGMPDALLLPAHGPVAGRVHERVDELIAHHEQRLEASLEALRTGAETAFEVSECLRWTRRGRVLADLDPFNQMLAVLETAAHLDLLVDRGYVSKVEVDGTFFYAIPG